MALVRCPECGHQISSQALACPSCGYPFHHRAASPPEKPQNALQSPHVWGRVALALGAWLVTPWIARLIVALAVCVLAYFMFTGR